MHQLSIGIRILRPIKVLSVLIFVVLFTTGCSTLSINKDLQDTKNYKQTQSYQDAEKEFTEYEIKQFTTATTVYSPSTGSGWQKFLLISLVVGFLFFPFRNKKGELVVPIVYIIAAMAFGDML
jgi:hypothetical protein